MLASSLKWISGTSFSVVDTRWGAKVVVLVLLVVVVVVVVVVLLRVLAVLLVVVASRGNSG